jgi:hypothetical protein
MKKLLGILVLSLLWCNVGFAGILDQNKYLCKTEDKIARTEISILKKYSEGYVLASENFGFGEIVAFAKVENDSLMFSFLDESGYLTVEILSSLKNNIREFKSTTYGLGADKINKLKSNSTKFGDVKSKYPTFELTENELNKEIEFYNNVNSILSSLENEDNDMSSMYICDVGNEVNKGDDTSKPPVGMIDVMKEGCKGDKTDIETLTFCECYGNWFYENLNLDQFSEFLHMSTEDKRKFISKNNIMNQCRI